MALLDEYQMPSFEPDPELVKRAQQQARAAMAIRMGLGMLGNEPLGKAAQGGFNTYFETQENARRQAQQQMVLALEQHKLQQQYQEDLRKAMFIKTMDTNTLLAAGVPQVMIDAVKLSKDPADAVLKMNEFFKPQTAGPGAITRNWAGGVMSQNPSEGGLVTKFDEYGKPVGRELLPGSAEAAQTLAAATAGGQAQYQFKDVPVRGNPLQTQQMSAYQLRQEEMGAGGAQPQRQFAGPPAVAAYSAQQAGMQPDRDVARVNLLLEEYRKAQLDGRKQDEEAIKKELAIITKKVGRTAGDIANPERIVSAPTGARISDPLAVKQAESDISEAAKNRESLVTNYLGQIKTDFPVARQAVEAIGLNHKALAMLDSGKVLTGKGAEIGTAVGGWLAQAGFNQAEDPVANTQAFMVTQAREALAILGTRQLGSGTGISEKDLQFAKDIAGGNVTLTEDALRKVIKINEASHRLKIKDLNESVGRVSEFVPQAKSLYGVEMPPEYSKGQAMQAEPNALAVQALRKNPAMAGEFDRKFGKGASARYLGR